jgi:hypothetical protein
MNKILKTAPILAAAALVLAGCEDDYYMEGRITTSAATDVTSQSALLSGEVRIATAGDKVNPDIAVRGFMLGTSPNDLTRTVNDKIGGEGVFSCQANNLLPNTKYYVKAYAAIGYAENLYRDDGYDNDDNMFYGNTVNFTTQDGEVVTPPAPSEYVVVATDGIAVQKNDRSSGATWPDANALCNSLTLGGYSDWRLPTQGELISLCAKKASIGGFSTDWYWSSTIYNSSYSSAVNFSNGNYTTYGNSATYRVRCVRTLP